MERRNNRSNSRRSWWRRLQRAGVIVIGFMTAMYWTLRVVQASIDLHNTVAPW